MKITDHKTLIELNDYLKGIKDKTPRQAANVKDADRGSGTDRVEISQKSREIQSVREMVEAVPDVRDVKVKELKESIENGTYNVEGETIADNMIKRSLVDTLL